jgi:acetyltransferase-like isoleucine patch superfamily enzyme
MLDDSEYRRFLATSDHWVAKGVRRLRKEVEGFSIPAPRAITVPALWGFLAGRSTLHWMQRVLVCEPLTKAYCTQHGADFHTSTFVPWISGKGDLIVGDHVTFSGQISISFAARYAARPRVEIGNHSGMSHGSSLVVGKSIRIGNYVRIGQNVSIRDSNGHASDPAARMRGDPPQDDEVKPVVIEDNVWIGSGVYIGPGIVVGEGSIIAAHSVVMSNVPAYSVFAGFPARKIGTLQPPAAGPAATTPAATAPAATTPAVPTSATAASG